jgi:uncharacterized membrane protein
MSTNSATEETTVLQMRFRPTLRAISIVLVIIGLLVSGYLSYAELTDTSTVCADTGSLNCDVVQNSVYSQIMGIKIAYLGFATYVALLLLLALEDRIGFLREYGMMLVFGITLFAFLFSMWLIYVQAVLLQAFCQWCLAHEVTMTLLFGISMWRLRNMLMAKA